jgi:hypothetical protein
MLIGERYITFLLVILLVLLAYSKQLKQLLQNHPLAGKKKHLKSMRRHQCGFGTNR